MARIKLPKIDELTAEQKAQYDLFPCNLVLGLLKTTGATLPYLSLGATYPKGRLSNKDQQMIILRVGYLSNSPYERLHHYQMAIDAGWTDEEICKTERGNGVDARTSAILRFVQECVSLVKVSDEAFKNVAQYYDETQLAEGIGA